MSKDTVDLDLDTLRRAFEQMDNYNPPHFSVVHHRENGLTTLETENGTVVVTLPTQDYNAIMEWRRSRAASEAAEKKIVPSHFKDWEPYQAYPAHIAAEPDEVLVVGDEVTVWFFNQGIQHEMSRSTYERIYKKEPYTHRSDAPRPEMFPLVSRELNAEEARNILMETSKRYVDYSAGYPNAIVGIDMAERPDVSDVTSVLVPDEIVVEGDAVTIRFFGMGVEEHMDRRTYLHLYGQEPVAKASSAPRPERLHECTLSLTEDGRHIVLEGYNHGGVQSDDFIFTRYPVTGFSQHKDKE